MHSVHSTDSAEPMLQNTASGPDHEPLLQSTAGIHIIFVNIDWKKSRHNSQKSTENNLRRLSLTIASIVVLNSKSNYKERIMCYISLIFLNMTSNSNLI